MAQFFFGMLTARLLPGVNRRVPVLIKSIDIHFNSVKAICTFRNGPSRTKLEKDKSYEIVIDERLENGHVSLNTIASRLEYIN